MLTRSGSGAFELRAASDGIRARCMRPKLGSATAAPTNARVLVLVGHERRHVGQGRAALAGHGGAHRIAVFVPLKVVLVLRTSTAI
jgi:hypothetical protein